MIAPCAWRDVGVVVATRCARDNSRNRCAVQRWDAAIRDELAQELPVVWCGYVSMCSVKRWVALVDGVLAVSLLQCFGQGKSSLGQTGNAISPNFESCAGLFPKFNSAPYLSLFYWLKIMWAGNVKFLGLLNWMLYSSSVIGWFVLLMHFITFSLSELDPQSRLGTLVEIDCIKISDTLTNCREVYKSYFPRKFGFHMFQKPTSAYSLFKVNWISGRLVAVNLSYKVIFRRFFEDFSIFDADLFQIRTG